MPTSFPTTNLFAVLGVIAALHFGQAVFIPIALAALLGFLLAPIVVRLRRWGLGRISAVLAAVTFAFTLIFAVGSVVTWQVNGLARQLPHYQQNIEDKIGALTEGGGLVQRATTMLRELRARAAGDGAGAAAEPDRPPAAGEPIPVEVHQPEPSPLRVIGGLLWTLGGPATTAGIVVVFVIFMLIEREDLRDRLIRLLGAGQIHVTTQLLDEAASRVSRYLLMQLVVNATYGIPVGIGLYFIGVPSPVLWGLLAILLRFIPYVGPAVAATFPVLLAFAVDPGWTMPLLTIALFLTIELISNNAVEPWLYGTQTGLSALAVLVAALFWTWLWGPIGLFLSTPLTVCLVVAGHYFARLEFFSILFGDEPVLPPGTRFYQRMLALDPEEAADLAEEYLASHSLEALYDQVIVPALSLAERDRESGGVDERRRRQVLRATRELVDYLGDHTPGDDRPAAAGQGGVGVLCIPAMDEADEVVAAMLAQLLRRRGLAARVLEARLSSLESMELVAREKVGSVCVSTVPPHAILHAGYVCRRLRNRFAQLPIIAGLWGVDTRQEGVRARLAAIPANATVSLLGEAVEQAARWAGGGIPAGTVELVSSAPHSSGGETTT